ncbi:cell envelope integrity protein TolA [Priestia sp. TSO9]|uniref:cell envelope integrity protein TolA n=1 Tax=Priestia sp. TSO9 TaxID=2885632 RepID=UPI001E54684D|nr:cell envelope integrity protein TolA [Priestia sp. TSO9]
MKMLKIALGVPLLVLALTACGQENSEPASRQEQTKSETAVHTKEASKGTADTLKEASPSTLHTKSTKLQKAANANNADRNYLMDLMAGYQYIQVGNNEYIYYGINQEENIFSIMQVTFDNDINYIQDVNIIDNASANQIATLQSQIQNQQAQLSDLEQKQMKKELDDYYTQLEADQKAKTEADDKAAEVIEAQAKADEEAQEQADQEAKAQAEADKKDEEEAQAQAKAEADARAKEEAAAAQKQDEAEADSQEPAEQPELTQDQMESVEAANDVMDFIGDWLSPEASQKIQEELAASGDGSSPTLDHCYRAHEGAEEDSDGFCSAQ